MSAQYECPCGFCTDWHASFAVHTRTCEHPDAPKTAEDKFEVTGCCDSMMIWLVGSPREFIEAFLASGEPSLRIDQTEGRTAYQDYRMLGSAIARGDYDAHVVLSQGKCIIIRGRRPKKVYKERTKK